MLLIWKSLKNCHLVELIKSFGYIMLTKIKGDMMAPYPSIEKLNLCLMTKS